MPQVCCCFARQDYEDKDDIEPGSNLDLSLEFLEEAVRNQQVRAVPIAVQKRRLLVYTDASAVGTKVRIGAMVIDPEGETEVMVYDPPEDVVAAWGDGDTIINQAELHAIPVVASTMPETLRSRDAIMFIDNSAAESALVKAGSPTQTMCQIALVATAALASLRVRAWYEHVPSADNPADVLSRAGLDDETVAAKVQSGEYVVRVPVEPPQDAHLNYSYWWGQVRDETA